jgi:hypothetical protein
MGYTVCSSGYAATDATGVLGCTVVQGAHPEAADMSAGPMHVPCSFVFSVPQVMALMADAWCREHIQKRLT